ncbi:MAG TPA: hypothetical protein DER09_09470 [Prolixibacteraceae bacterium]|nr:hypothetical protein [Prolixibacteraceae bacterium]
MRIISGILLSILALFLFSCAEKPQFPEKRSEKFPAAALTVSRPFFQYESNFADSLPEQIVGNELQQLKSFISKYENRDESFSVEKMESLWESENKRIESTGSEAVLSWIEVTGFLLEITGKPLYAEELQKLSTTENMGLSASEFELTEQQLAPFIFTKNVDHIFVNFFVNSSVEYVHSLGGKVKITQELTGSNSLLLKFSTTDKRYIEVNILIPSGAKNATVTEKNVKYVATPGEYCLIARKWKEGDVVEVKY